MRQSPTFPLGRSGFLIFLFGNLFYVYALLMHILENFCTFSFTYVPYREMLIKKSALSLVIKQIIGLSAVVHIPPLTPLFLRRYLRYFMLVNLISLFNDIHDVDVILLGI